MHDSADMIDLSGAYFEILLLNQGGYCCSQILVKLALKKLGRENPDLVRAMAPLCHGIGYSGGTCGVLTGAVCALSLSLGSGEHQDPALPSRMVDLVGWFTARATDSFGGIRCHDILAASPDKRACAALMVEALEKISEMTASAAAAEELQQPGTQTL